VDDDPDGAELEAQPAGSAAAKSIRASLVGLTMSFLPWLEEWEDILHDAPRGRKSPSGAVQ
jgi:hypothetical protein